MECGQLEVRRLPQLRVVRGLGQRSPSPRSPEPRHIAAAFGVHLEFSTHLLHSAYNDRANDNQEVNGRVCVTVSSS